MKPIEMNKIVAHEIGWVTQVQREMFGRCGAGSRAITLMECPDLKIHKANFS